MWKRIKPFVAHASIVLCNMYVVFFCIDLVNQPMNFIDNRYTKLVLLALCATSFHTAWQLLRLPRRTSGAAASPRAGAGRAPARPQTSPARRGAGAKPRPERMG